MFTFLAEKPEIELVTYYDIRKEVVLCGRTKKSYWWTRKKQNIYSNNISQ
jgi:hypothetical protein